MFIIVKVSYVDLTKLNSKIMNDGFAAWLQVLRVIKQGNV